jgi:hypothetical protein
MAISVDDVYKTVLFILNKEQRGYMPPAEFNRIATHVQREIFEGYFQYENKQYRLPDNESEYSDRSKSVDEKISALKRLSGSLTKTSNYFEQPNDFYKLGTVIYTDPKSNQIEVQRIQENDLLYVNMSPLTKPSLTHPIYTYRDNKIYVHSGATDVASNSISISYLKDPSDVVWSYYIDNATGGYLWDGNGVPANPHTGPFPATGSVNFELHEVEQTEVIIKILMYAGVIIRDPQIVQTASQLDQQETIQENS